MKRRARKLSIELRARVVADAPLPIGGTIADLRDSVFKIALEQMREALADTLELHDAA